MRPPRYGTGTLMLLIAVAALAAALVAQHFRAARREFRLRADLYRLTPTPSRGGDGAMAPVCDRLVIAFRPTIYRREPGARFRWRFELVEPSSGAVALSWRDDREVEVPAGQPYNPGYLEVIDRLPPPGEYRAVHPVPVRARGRRGGGMERDARVPGFRRPAATGRRGGRRRAAARGPPRHALITQS